MNHIERLAKEERKDKRFARAMSLCRVRKICDFLGQNLTSSQITEKLNTLPKIRPDKRGNESVDNVREAIKFLPSVKRVQKTSQQSFEDRCLKYDLIVDLSKENIDYVGVQVKSSRQAILEFYQRINPNHCKVEDILIKKQLIVLNGQLPQLEIRQDFLDQFSSIKNFYLNNPKT